MGAHEPGKARHVLGERQGRAHRLHLRGHEARERPRGGVFPFARHRQGRHGDAHSEAPLRILVFHSRASQTRRRLHSRDAPADEEGHRLPLQRGEHQGDRLRRRQARARPRRLRAAGLRDAEARRLHGTDRSRGLRGLQEGLRGRARVRRRPRQRERRHFAALLHVGNDGQSEDGRPRLHVSARAHRHGLVLAQSDGRQSAPHRRGHGLGQGGLGQALRAMDRGRVRLRVRPRKIHAARHAADDFQIPHHLVLRAADGLPLHAARGHERHRHLQPEVVHNRGRSAQPVRL